MANRELTPEEEVAAEIMASAAAPSQYQSFADATNQLVQQGVTAAPPSFEEATQALVQQGMPQEAAPMPTATPMMSPESASPYAEAGYGPQGPYTEFAQAVENFRQPRGPLAPTGSISQDAIGAQMQAQLEASSPQLTTEGSNLLMAQEAPEAFDAMVGGMAGTGLQANMPAPLAPAVAPNALQPELDPSTQLAAEQAQAEIVASQARARDLAAQSAQLQAQHAAQIEQAATDSVEAQDQKAAGQDWGSIIGQGLAVAMGEYGRYLTGGKENLGVKAIERAVEEKARKEKMSMEEKLAGKREALELAQLKLREEEMKTDSQLKRAQIAKINAEIGQEHAKVKMQQRVTALIKSGKGFGAEDLAILPESMQEKAVLLPNGKYGLAAVNKERLNKGQETITANTNAKNSLKELMDLADYFGNNPGKKVMSFEQKTAAKTLAQSLKGQLRLSLLGPGAITDYEHEMLNNIIRDPTALLSLGSSNKKALEVIMNKVNAENNYAYRSLGINLPPTKNKAGIEYYKKQYGLTDAQAVERLTKLGEWEN
jgi:hypothetical protein